MVHKFWSLASSDKEEFRRRDRSYKRSASTWKCFISWYLSISRQLLGHRKVSWCIKISWCWQVSKSWHFSWSWYFFTHIFRVMSSMYWYKYLWYINFSFPTTFLVQSSYGITLEEETQSSFFYYLIWISRNKIEHMLCVFSSKHVF